MKGTDEDPKLMALISIVASQENSYNVEISKETIDQYKENMVIMKDNLVKERGEGQEIKKKHEVTLLELERI